MCLRRNQTSISAEIMTVPFVTKDEDSLICAIKTNLNSVNEPKTLKKPKKKIKKNIFRGLTTFYNMY